MKTKNLIFTLLSLSALVLGGCNKNNSSDQGQKQDEEQKGETHTHSWQAPTWTWNEYESATAHFVCSADASHTHDEAATITKVTTAATCVSDGKEVYTATISFNNQNYQDTKEKVLPATGIHDKNDYGFCKDCGVYQGSDREMEYSSLILALGDLEEGKKVFFRFAAVEGHGYHIEDWDAWSWENEEILDDVKAYVLKNEQFVEYPLTASVVNDEPVDLADDEYLYIVVTPSETKEAAMIDIVEDHIFNAAGVCEADGEFISYSNGNRGYSIPKGSESKVGISYQDNQTIDYYKIVKDIYPFANHKFNITLTNIPASDVELYCVDANYAAHKISVEVGNEDEVPENADELFVAIKHSSNVENGSFALKRVEHCNMEHGYCPDCDIVYEGNLLTVNGGYSSAISLVEGKTYNYYFEIDGEYFEFYNTGDNVFRHKNGVQAANYRLYVYSLIDGFVLVEPVDTDEPAITYDIGPVYYDVSYVLFEFDALADQADFQLMVTTSE